MDNLDFSEMNKLLIENLANKEKYDNHAKRVSEYQKKNPKKITEKQIKYYNKMKNESPEKYKEMMEKKKKYYEEVIKPSRLLQKKENEKKDITNEDLDE